MNIPYEPKFQRTANLVRNLAEASSLRTWIHQQAVDVSWMARSQRDALVRLAHYSTRIEGNPLTLSEVEALAEGKEISAEKRAQKEVLNYFAALRWIWTESPRTGIQEKQLLQLHRILTEGILSKEEIGVYKTKPNVVYGEGRVIYRPPPPEAAPILTKAMLDWLNSKKAREEHAVIAAAIAHHRLVSIHPFLDGNGRAARALESWILYRRDFDTHHIFALDEFFETDRQRYYREIQQVRKRGDDLTSWLEYVSEGILETLRRTQVRIQTLRTKTSAAKMVVNPKQERILQIFAETPRLAGGDLARSMGITRSFLSKLIKPLVKVGLVVKEGSTKAAAYRLGGASQLAAERKAGAGKTGLEDAS